MAASRSTRTCARTCTALLLGGILTLLGGVQQVGAAAFASPAPEHPQADPQGNAGVVKIDALPFDDHPDNQPHVGCTFQIDLTGFAAGHAPVGITFAAHHPTLAGGDDQVLLTDELTLTPGAHGSGASKTYVLDLDGITPHPQQGVHVKLTVDTGLGAGKHKVFWVKGCGTPPPSSSSSSTTSTTRGHGHEHGSTSTSEQGEEGGSTTTTTGARSSPATTAPPSTTAVVAGAGGQGPGGGQPLPFTGADSVRLLLVAAALLVAGGLLLRAGRLRAAARARHDHQPPAPGA